MRVRPNSLGCIANPRGGTGPNSALGSPCPNALGPAPNALGGHGPNTLVCPNALGGHVPPDARGHHPNPGLGSLAYVLSCFSI